MMILRIMIGLTAAGLLAACSEEVLSFYNRSLAAEPYKTFAVMAPEAGNELPPAQQLADKQIRDILTTELENKGLEHSALPDLYVSYFVSTQATSETTTNYASPYGYPYGRPWGYGYPYSPFDYNTTTRQYKSGVLVIDIKNAAGKLVWQGSKAFRVRAKESISSVLPPLAREIIAEFHLPAVSDRSGAP